MSDPEQDDVFEAYLKRQPVLPALDDKPEPPAAVDQQVLNQARQAIQPGDVGKRAPQRPPRWAVPVALAATILLCLSVVMNISLNTNRPSSNSERIAASRADVKTSALANATAESDAAAGVSAPAPRAPVMAEASAPATPSGASGAVADSKQPEVTASANGVAPAPEQSQAANAGGGPASAASPSAGDKAVLMAKDAGAAAPQYTPAPEQERTAASARKAAKAAAAVAPHPADPKVWLQQIDALRAAGKADQADAEMRRFKAVFPHYEASPDPRK